MRELLIKGVACAWRGVAWCEGVVAGKTDLIVFLYHNMSMISILQNMPITSISHCHSHRHKVARADLAWVDLGL